MALERTETVLSGGARPPWDDTAMSGTAKRVTDPLDLGERVRDVSWCVPWANDAEVTGAFDVEETNDDPDDSPNWVPVPDAAKVLPGVSDSAGPGMVRARVLGRYARLVYTNASGTGTLSDPSVQGKLD
jgi:hypothetical protein